MLWAGSSHGESYDSFLQVREPQMEIGIYWITEPSIPKLQGGDAADPSKQLETRALCIWNLNHFTSCLLTLHGLFTFTAHRFPPHESLSPQVSYMKVVIPERTLTLFFICSSRKRKRSLLAHLGSGPYHSG